MDKSVLESFVNNLKSVGVEKYSIRYEDCNRFTEHGSESGRIFLKSDYALILETRTNYGSDKGALGVTAVPYEEISDASSFDLTTKEIIDFLTAEGIDLDEDLKKFISAHGAKVAIRPGTAGYGVPVDKDGKPILNNSFPNVTAGANPEFKVKK